MHFPRLRTAAVAAGFFAVGLLVAGTASAMVASPPPTAIATAVELHQKDPKSETAPVSARVLPRVPLEIGSPVIKCDPNNGCVSHVGDPLGRNALAGDAPEGLTSGTEVHSAPAHHTPGYGAAPIERDTAASSLSSVTSHPRNEQPVNRGATCSRPTVSHHGLGDQGRGERVDRESKNCGAQSEQNGKKPSHSPRPVDTPSSQGKNSHAEPRGEKYQNPGAGSRNAQGVAGQSEREPRSG